MARRVSFYGQAQAPLQMAPQRSRQLEMAQALMATGGSTAPVQTMGEGLARALQGAVGGFVRDRAERQEKERGQKYSADMAAALAGGQAKPWVNPDTGQQQGAAGGIPGMISALQSSGNPDMAPMMQQLTMQQIAQHQAEQQRQQQLRDAKDLYQFQQKNKAPVPGRDVPLPADVAAQQAELKKAGARGGKYYAVPTGNGTMLVDKQSGMAQMLGVGPDGAPVAIGKPFMPVQTGDGQPVPIPMDQAQGIMGGLPGQPQAQPLLMSDAPETGGFAGQYPQPSPLMPPSLAAPQKGEVTRAQEQAKAQVKRQEEGIEAGATMETQFAPLDRLSSTVDDLISSPGLEDRTGLSSYLPAVTQGDDARNTQAKMKTLKSQVAQSVLQMYRNMSQTGGAVGQVSNFEQEMFQNNLAALDQAQTMEEFTRQVSKIKEFAEGSKRRIMDAYQRQYGGQPAQTNESDPLGLFQ